MKKLRELKLNKGFVFTLHKKWEREQAQWMIDNDSDCPNEGDCDKCIFMLEYGKDWAQLCCDRSGVLPKKYKKDSIIVRYWADAVLRAMGYTESKES